MPTAAYVELPPPPALAPWVRCLWAARVGPGGQLVVPDACTDVIVSPGSPAAVAGPQTEAVVAALPAGTEMVGIRFAPGLAAAALGLPVDLLRDATPRLDQVWGPAGEELGERVAAAASLPAALAAVERAFLDRLPVLRRVDPRVVAAVERLALPGARVGDLGRDLDLSERQLHRRVTQAVGYGPKTLDRVLRFQRFLALADRTRWRLAALAHAAGYADQAHLSRDCRRLSGLTPSALLAHRSRPASDPFKNR
jgi:AraC-like DNA-binding protein